MCREDQLHEALLGLAAGESDFSTWRGWGAQGGAFLKQQTQAFGPFNKKLLWEGRPSDMFQVDSSSNQASIGLQQRSHLP